MERKKLNKIIEQSKEEQFNNADRTKEALLFILWLAEFDNRQFTHTYRQFVTDMKGYI